MGIGDWLWGQFGFKKVLGVVLGDFLYGFKLLAGGAWWEGGLELIVLFKIAVSCGFD